MPALQVPVNTLYDSAMLLSFARSSEARRCHRGENDEDQALVYRES
jgi:hypothetical protein